MAPARILAFLAVTLSLAAGCAAPAGAGREPRPDQPIAAARFRYIQRLSEDGTVPEHALMRAKAHRDAMIAAMGAKGAGADAPRWTWLGPGNIGGRLRGIIIHPTQPSVMWVGACSGGVWKTTNGGGVWAPLDDYLPSLAVGCMAIDPTNPDVLYVGTGEGFFETVEGTSNTAAVRGAGIFRTTDGGATWSQLPSTATSDWYFVNRIAISPADRNIMLAATNTGLYRTTDAGATWARVRAGVVYDVQWHPADPARLVAGLHDGPPAYSTDAGQTWTNATGATGHRVEVRYAPGSPATVYAAVSASGAIRVYRSTDGGVTYTLRTTGSGVSTYEAYNSVLWVDPANANTLVLGGVYIYRSTDGGATFAQTFNSIHADMHIITQHPAYNGSTNRTIFVGCDGGIYRVDDAYGAAATELNNNLGVTQFYGAAVNANGVVVGGTQDNGTLRYAGNTEDWTSVIGGDGGHCAADPTDPNYFYGETQWLAVRRSTNGGTSFSSISSGITDAGGTNTNFIPYFMLDPNDPNRMLAAARRLWRSNNAKTGNPPAWTIIKPGIESPAPPWSAHFAENSPFNISTIAVAEGDPNLIYVGYNNGEVWKSTNGTQAQPAWTRLDANGVGLPNRWVNRIVIDRSNHDRVFVAIMGWANDNVWMTDDAGQTWRDISGSGPTGLPPAPVSSLAQHRLEPNRLFAGTDIGIFTTSDMGQTWTPTTQGPGTVPVDELIWKDDRTLLAVTHGRGVYAADVDQALALSLVQRPADPTPPGQAPPLRVRIEPASQQVEPGSERVFYRAGPGPFTPLALTPLGGGVYEVVLPAARCADTPEYYVSARGDAGATVTLPAGAPTAVLAHRVGVLTTVFHDTFETDTGWTAQNLGATSGDWQRGVPVNDPGWAYDPERDSDGSGRCFLTQNAPGNTDVDNGAVQLTSPRLDFSAPGLTLSYDYYLNMTDPRTTDHLVVQASSTDLAGPWTEIARHAADGGLSWRAHSMTGAELAARGLALTPTVRLRFIATDGEPQSIVEAGLDAFRVWALSCEDPCYPDCDTSTGPGVLDVFDFLCFQNAFDAGDPYACDCDTSTGPGVCDVFDFLCFQNAFDAGCP